MKKIFIILLLSNVMVFAQFKDQKIIPDIKGSITNNSPSQNILGFFNPNNFSMKHSISLSYATAGGNAISLGVYTNSMMYKFSDKLNIQVDASLVNSPYSSFGKEFSNQINGIYLSKAEVNYQPSDNFKMSIRFSQYPGNYLSPRGYYSGYSPFYHDDYFFDR